jgi:uncharacterized protein YjbJ (UPF0337 family)
LACIAKGTKPIGGSCSPTLSGTLRDVRRSTDSRHSRRPQTKFKKKEPSMNWDRIEGNWKQFTGKVKEKWGKLTDDDLTQVNGNREQLEGKIQARYGYAKDQAKKEVDDWLSRS